MKYTIESAINEEEIKAEIEIGWGGSLEFVITSYEETTLN